MGGAKREIHVLVDPTKLRAYDLTVTDVFNALRTQNLELPGGSLNAGAREFTVRTTGRVADAVQFNQFAIANRNGYAVKVSDIGYAEDSYEEPHRASRLDGIPAVTLVVSKQSGENTVATADEVHDRLATIRKGLPRDVNGGDPRRSVGLHQSVGGIDQEAPDRRQYLRGDHHLRLPRQLRTTLIASSPSPRRSSRRSR